MVLPRLLMYHIIQPTSSLEPSSYGLAGLVRLMLVSLKSLIKYLAGFNGGSALGANLRAAQACIVTNLAASVGGITWMLWVLYIVVVRVLFSTR